MKFLFRRPAEEQSVVFDDERIAESVVLIAHLEERARKLHTLFDAEALAERAGRDVADDDFERDDVDAFDELVRVVYLLHEVRLYAVVGEKLEELRRDLVVENALAAHGRLLLSVESGEAVLILDYHIVRVFGRVKSLGFAFVDEILLCQFHLKILRKM